MDGLSDDDFDHVRDFDLSDPESEVEPEHDTPSTTPPRTQTPRPSDRKIIPCPYEDCTKTFNRNARLRDHIRTHTGEKPFVCDEDGCTKRFFRESHLKHHKKSAHTDIRDYVCTWESCDKSFATGTRLRRHLASHEGKEKYKCRGYEGCNETFRKHETLKRHILSVHQNKKPFPCNEIIHSTGETCTKFFDTADKLKGHKRAMHDSTRFSCTICLENSTESSTKDMDACYFATFTELQDHIAAVHPPTCPFCPTAFLTNKELKRHLELQHGIVDEDKANTKQFPCTYSDCKQVFTKRGNLNVHVKTVHEQKKDFVCGRSEVPVPPEHDGDSQVYAYGCGRAFTSRASLIEHVRVTHFHLPSRRSLQKADRRGKRRAVATDDEEDTDMTSSVKKRAPRSDKGVKKSSTLSALTGLRMTADSSTLANPNTTFTSYPPMSNNQEISQVDPDYHEDANDEKEDDVDQLSGSMTLFGEHLYHNGKGYRLVSEDGSAEQSMLGEGQYMPCRSMPTGINQEYEDDMEPPFYFEHEPEYIHPIPRSVIDPVLLQS